MQNRVGAWCRSTFGDEVATNRKERALRVLEEALELAQAEGVSRLQVYVLADRTYSRPVGEPAQEVSGIGVTILAYCAATGVNFLETVADEMDRVEQPEVVERIRVKQAEKKAAGTSAV